MSDCCENTDKEIWRESDEVFCPSIHVTERGGIGIDVGGYVTVKPVREWHKLAAERDVYKKALEELVTLKDMKTLNGDSPDYRKRKPLAWEAARKALTGGQDE